MPSETLDRDTLALAFEVMGDCAALIGLDGTVLDLNAAGVAALAMDGAAAAVGRNWLALWSAPDQAAARQALAEAGANGRASLRTALGCGEHDRRWWDSTMILVAGPNGGPDRVLTISREVTGQIEAGDALDRSARLQNALIEATSEIVWHFDASTGLTLRRGYSDFTGEQDDPANADGWLAAVHPDDKDLAKRAADQAEIARHAVTIEYRLRHRSGQWRWVEDHAVPLIDDTGAPTDDWVGIISDVDERKSAEQALQKSAEHLRLALEATGLCTWDVDLATNERAWSPGIYDLLELSPDVAPDRALFLDRVHPDDRTRVVLELGESMEAKRTIVCRLVSVTADERWIEISARTLHEADGRPIRQVGTIQDVTARKMADRKVWIAAHTDALTGAANRTLFQARLDEAVADAISRSSSVGLFLIDLDRFKEINDTLGHDAGDLLLGTVADRLQRQVDPSTTVARLGGDEFGLVVPAPASLTALQDLAARLLAALAEPMTYAGVEVDCSSSIGWAAYPDHDPVASTLLKNADVALYTAKAAGRGCAKSFAPAMRDDLDRRVNVLRYARDALGRDAILPFYQPKVSLLTGAIVGFEALLRWTDGRGLRLPGEILEALDHPELSAKIGARMLDCVVADMQAWTAAGIAFGHVGVNVAAVQLQDAGFAKRTLALLQEAKLRPDHLEVEVTERVLLDGGTGVMPAVIRQMHDAGVPVVLDDFGTGYASLAHLTRFPVGWVKIDRSFIADMDRDRSAMAIVKGIVRLSHGIGIKVVAEGIETRAQMKSLAKLGCDLGQGYLLAKPMSGSRVPFFVNSWTGLAAPIARRRAAAP